MIRVGVGFDSHPFVEGRPLILGGQHIPYERGLPATPMPMPWPMR